MKSWSAETIETYDHTSAWSPCNVYTKNIYWDLCKKDSIFFQQNHSINQGLCIFTLILWPLCRDICTHLYQNLGALNINLVKLKNTINLVKIFHFLWKSKQKLFSRRILCSILHGLCFLHHPMMMTLSLTLASASALWSTILAYFVKSNIIEKNAETTCHLSRDLKLIKPSLLIF